MAQIYDIRDHLMNPPTYMLDMGFCEAWMMSFDVPIGGLILIGVTSLPDTTADIIAFPYAERSKPQD